jgi:hypothetical protein
MYLRLASFMRSLRSRQYLAAGLVSVLTLAVIGVVLVATTSVGCGPAKALGLKSIAARCSASVALASPTPSLSQVASPSASQFPTPSASPSPTGAVVPDSGPATAAYPPFVPAATGAGGTAIPGVSFNCRLPVYAGPSGSGGFIVFPGGSFIADPTSAVSLPSPSPGHASPAPTPSGYGQPQYPGLSYDRAYSRWLPVPLSQVTPDGSRYAFPSTDSIYVVDVASGRLSEVGPGHAWNIVGVQAAGVYATQPNTAGLWFLPYSGASRQLTTAGYWQAASADAAYGTATAVVPQGAANTIIRLDLTSGTVTDWFTRAGVQSAVGGFDAAGHLIAYVGYGGTGTEVWIVTNGPASATPIGGLASVAMGGPPVGDSHGVWFAAAYRNPYTGSQPGIAAYIAGSGVYWMSNIVGQLAGPCI